MLIFQNSRLQNVSILDFIGAKDDGDGGGNWSYKMHKAPVKLSPPTNQLFTGRMSFLSCGHQRLIKLKLKVVAVA